MIIYTQTLTSVTTLGVLDNGGRGGPLTLSEPGIAGVLRCSTWRSSRRSTGGRTAIFRCLRAGGYSSLSICRDASLFH